MQDGFLSEKGDSETCIHIFFGVFFFQLKENNLNRKENCTIMNFKLLNWQSN